MSRTNEPSFLAKLADLFRAEGDPATADALVARCESTSARLIGDEDRDRALALQRKGIRLDNQGNHEEAEGCFAGALRLIEDALCPEHVDVIDHLNDLARCRFSDGDFEAALQDYRRLLRLVELAHGSDDMLAKITRLNITNCQQGLRASTGARRLHVQLEVMLRQAQGVRGVEDAAYQQRLRELAGRLIASGRVTAGARLLERWIKLRLHEATPDGEAALQDIRDYAIALWNGGQPERAVNALSAVVLMRTRRLVQDGHEAALKQSLVDLGACLAASGSTRSAQETRVLAESIGLPATQD